MGVSLQGGGAQGIAPPPGVTLASNVAYIPPGLEDCFKQPFSYVVQFPSIGATTQSVSTQINNDSYFVCTEQTASIWDADSQATTQILPGAFAAFATAYDTSSGKTAMSAPVPFSSLFGTGTLPYVWLYRAMIYKPGGQITVTLQSLVATAQTVTCVFTGFKVFDYADELATGSASG